jgi:SH3 domain-containing YSC84-like protein 1
MNKLILLVPMLAFAGPLWASAANTKVEERLQNAGEVLQEVMNAPDKGIPLEIVEHAKCIAVIPHQIKAGFVVAAKFGKGVATCRTERGWSAPAFFTITGGGWGAQIGIASIDNVLMIMNQRGMEHLLSAKFQIGADASGAAGPIGRHAAAGRLEDGDRNSELCTSQGCLRRCVARWSGRASRSGSHNNRVRQVASAPRNPDWERSTS